MRKARYDLHFQLNHTPFSFVGEKVGSELKEMKAYTIKSFYRAFNDCPIV
ncbi:hypothetical protein GZH82_11670 [Staphylococcus ursi]|nr:hypothetical protein [Staphylococcus sp. MI 10-1553]QHW37950.1 hypothetical protein GZH82_11670 [Staphylococcus sp. MI 10-1553]